jgi:uncharacterized protein YaiE (UPF0345 family)
MSDGLVEPLNVPPGQTTPIGVQPGVSQVAFNTVIVGGSGGGLFVYNGTPAFGNPPIFYASAGTKDPYNNPITPTVGLTGIGQFNAGNTIINTNGTFIYSGTPSSSNLIVSECPVATLDPFGTAAVQGVGVYITISLTKYILTFGQQNNLPAMSIQQATSVPLLPVIHGANAASSAGCSAYINSGQSVGGSVAAVIQAEDSTFAGVANGLIALIAGAVQLGSTGACQWQDNTQQFTIPAASGPFISGETFHSITLGSLTSGRIRVKKLPWNAIWCDIAVATPAAGTSFPVGSLPDATYYPTTILELALGDTNAAACRLVVPTSGALTVQIPAAGVRTLGGEFMWPTN